MLDRTGVDFGILSSVGMCGTDKLTAFHFDFIVGVGGGGGGGMCTVCNYSASPVAWSGLTALWGLVANEVGYVLCNCASRVTR